MKHFFVWVQLPDGTIKLAGELATTEPSPGSRYFEAEFQYAGEWANDPQAFALDPVSLPLDAVGRRFRAELFYPPLAVIDDALPDDWGRRLLSAALKREGRKATPPDMLLRMRGGGTGALIFTEEAEPPAADATVQSTALPELLSAAAKFEAGTLPSDAAFRRLLEGSSRAGGARPKALVHDWRGEWLAKFPGGVRDGGHDIVGLEATSLALARHAGLIVPDSELKAVGRRRVLLVRRFDVTEQGGRLHMVSMRTLCKERPGVYAQSYSDVAQVLRKHSAAPTLDLSMLFRHMVYNAAIGNVDDHLKNFWMLISPTGYRLAPAFDLIPDVMSRGEHTLMFHRAFVCPRRAELVAEGAVWGVSQPEALIDQVVEAVGAFAQTARKLKVRGGQKLENVYADVQRRIKRLSA